MRWVTHSQHLPSCLLQTHLHLRQANKAHPLVVDNLSDTDSIKDLIPTQVNPIELLSIQEDRHPTGFFTSSANQNLSEMSALKPTTPTMGNLVQASKDEWNASWMGGKPNKPS
jgi:hypothetical protein